MFAKYDTNQSGKLEHDQLKRVLAELVTPRPAPRAPRGGGARRLLTRSGGGARGWQDENAQEPSDEEVQWVLKLVDGALEGVDSTGGINKTEFLGAISLWSRPRTPTPPRPRARRAPCAPGGRTAGAKRRTGGQVCARGVAGADGGEQAQRLLLRLVSSRDRRCRCGGRTTPESKGCRAMRYDEELMYRL